MVLCIGWLADHLRFDLRLADAFRGALRLACCRGRNISRLSQSRCRSGERPGRTLKTGVDADSGGGTELHR